MSEVLERIRGINPDLGRRYGIDFHDAFDAVLDLEESFVCGYNDNAVTEFIDYIENDVKFDGLFTVHRDDILFKVPKSGLRYGAYFGIIQAKIQRNEPDLRDNSQEILISKANPSIKLVIPSVKFSGENQTPLISFSMIDKSLNILADYLKDNQHQDQMPPFIYGLTHPRMGRLSRRWGFELVDFPFAPEVYEFIKWSDAYVYEGERKLNKVDALKKVGEQVMVYQPTAKFIENYSTVLK